MIKKLWAWLQTLGAPQTLYNFSSRLQPYMWLGVVLCFAYGLYAGLVLAPKDYQQGDAFRIIYVHVPCAILSMGVYTLMALYSIIFLVWRIKIFDVLAVSCAPIGALFTFLALVTGSIWGKPMWGAWWVWDARLTSELILLFLYLGYMGLYNAIQEPKIAAKACAVLAVVGFVDIPIVHFSVEWWHTLHQGATISKLAAPSLAPAMLWPLLAMLLGFGFYFAAVLFSKVKAELINREYKSRWVQNILAGDLKP